MQSKTFTPNTITFTAAEDEIARTIEASGQHGIVTITDLPSPDMSDLASLFETLHQHPDLGSRANKAYTKNLVYKDSFASGNGGPGVDMKRVLDLSPERLDAIEQVDPGLTRLMGEGFTSIMEFWSTSVRETAPKILRALSTAVGATDMEDDAHYNFRMVDYPKRSQDSVPPRCGEHRDFGAFTLIFSDRPGLEINLNGEWFAVAVPPAHSATLVFGWCTQIRSNERLRAALHRVTDSTPVGGYVPRRLSAVLFCAPKDVNTELKPVVREGEQAVYQTVKAGQLRGHMGRKWRHREGTLSEEDKMLEEEEIRVTNMATQDDVVASKVRVHG